MSRLCTLCLFLVAVRAPATAQAKLEDEADSARGLIPYAGLQNGSGSYTVAAFPRALAFNTVGLLSRRNVLPLLIGSGLAVTGHSLDDWAKDSFGDQATGIGDVGDIIGSRYVVTGSILALFAAGQVASTGRFRRVTFDLAQGLIINGVITTGLKRAVARVRPDTSNAQSFPSGHTSSAFTLTTILARHLGLKVGVPAMLTATFVAVSRIEDNEHFLSDIVAGATLGLIVGRTVTANVDGGAADERPHLRVSPIPVRGGGGLAIQVTF